MENFSVMPTSSLIRPEGFECDCGKKHIASELKAISVGSGVINTLPEILSSLEIKKPFIVTDGNEYEAAGKTVEKILGSAGIPYSLHIIPCAPEKRVTPSEFAVGSIVLNLDVSCDAILCVGSGVMNDLCKVTANTTGKPLIVVATAPSMDGYASDVASMVINNIKLTLKEVIPSALICDVDIMSQAPMHMLHAGLGDMIGKFSALCEWKIATIVKGEDYCAETAALVRESLRRIVDGADGVKDRDPESIKSIAEGLILSGIAMAYAGHSRPASGLEHYFSHCWEMVSIAKGEEGDLHGIQVGVGTLIVLRIYEYLKTLKPDMERVMAAADSFDPKSWEANIRRMFVDTADGIIAMEKRIGKNGRAGRMARAEKIIANWDEILKIANEAPSFAEIEAIMKSAGMPTTPEEIGISKKEAIDAFICSRDIRDKYLLSSMIWDIGYMDDVASFLESAL